MNPTPDTRQRVDGREGALDSKDAYAIELYNSDAWQKTRFLGVPIAKYPSDLWAYQEIIHKVRPNTIIETGTWFGGSALFFITLMRLANVSDPRVITIDTEPQAPVKDTGIIQIVASSVDPTIAAGIKHFLQGITMVVLDSFHSKDHVLEELELYAPLVSQGSYLVVEDTSINGHPVYPDHGPGPFEALEEWLPKHPKFQGDRSCEMFGISTNPGGWLMRVR